MRRYTQFEETFGFNPDDFYDRVENGISSRRVAKNADKVVDCIFDWSTGSIDNTNLISFVVECDKEVHCRSELYQELVKCRTYRLHDVATLTFSDNDLLLNNVSRVPNISLPEHMQRILERREMVT